ncbi:MmcQ-like protein [Croceivirga radicis]|uniref:MmcQ-like protein n=1 Tax=Croceivirga radicis TaxID=1929488 RepID=A0A1V6LUF2_9FLAO|nr:MmcQ/YjbR family DNA-binding protein [Croceivirga radicis]OQD43667.1 MmcQ-like protein [Croceivirga radicis]
MHIEAIREYCLQKKGAIETFPFDESTLVFKVMDKMFALAPLERLPAQVNLKCDPEKAIELRETFDGVVLPGYHMNKKHWNTVILNNLEAREYKEMIDHSYNLVVAKLTKKQKEALAAIE